MARRWESFHRDLARGVLDFEAHFLKVTSHVRYADRARAAPATSSVTTSDFGRRAITTIILTR
jgi:hypothetical protein